MEQLTLENLKAQLEGGNYEKATELLSTFFESDITLEERGELYVTLASLQMEAENSLNRQKLEFIEQLSSQLKSLQKEERAMNDELDIDIARNKIGEM